MEGNDYLCASWFKLLIKGGSFPSIIAKAVFAKGRLFLCGFLPKFAVEMLKMRLSCDFLKKSCEKIWRYNKFVIILQV